MNQLLQNAGYKREDIHYYILMLMAPVLLTLYRYISMPADFLLLFPSLSQDISGIVMTYKLQFAGFFVLLFIIPFLHLKYWWKKPLSDFGFGLGDKKFGLKFVIFTLLLLVLPFAFAGSFDANVRLEYPLAKELILHRAFVPGYELCYIVFYYIAWEFFFRGYLLFGLSQRYGMIEAILIQTISSCLVHIDKPFAEIAGSIPVGIFLGYIALRSRSFWYVFLVHAALGVFTDLFIIYFQN